MYCYVLQVSTAISMGWVSVVLCLILATMAGSAIIGTTEEMRPKEKHQDHYTHLPIHQQLPKQQQQQQQQQDEELTTSLSQDHLLDQGKEFSI